MTTTTFAITVALSLGPVELTVGNIDRSIDYYTRSVGLQVLSQDSGTVEIGLPGRPLAVLREIPDALPAPVSLALSCGEGFKVFDHGERCSELEG